MSHRQVKSPNMKPCYVECCKPLNLYNYYVNPELGHENVLYLTTYWGGVKNLPQIQCGPPLLDKISNLIFLKSQVCFFNN